MYGFGVWMDATHHASELGANVATLDREARGEAQLDHEFVEDLTDICKSEVDIVRWGEE